MGGALRLALAAEGEPTFVVRVEPEDGAAGVLRDSPVLLRLSRRVDPGSVSVEALEIRDPSGPVPTHVELSPDGFVLILRPRRLFAPDLEHVVLVSGLRDRTGRQVAAHRSRFAPCGLSGADLLTVLE